jgi:hypothetical protein
VSEWVSHSVREELQPAMGPQDVSQASLHPEALFLHVAAGNPVSQVLAGLEGPAALKLGREGVWSCWSELGCSDDSKKQPTATVLSASLFTCHAE